MHRLVRASHYLRTDRRHVFGALRAAISILDGEWLISTFSEMLRRSRARLHALPGLRWRTSHLPRPDGKLPLTSSLAAVAHKARQEIAAGEPVLALGRRDRGDGAVCAGLGVLPRHGGVLAAVGKHLADRRAAIARSTSGGDSTSHFAVGRGRREPVMSGSFFDFANRLSSWSLKLQPSSAIASDKASARRQPP